MALGVLIAAHRVASLLRFHPLLGKIVDHRLRVLIAHGLVRHRELRRCGITLEDLYSQLRQRGVFSIEDIRYVLYENKGGMTIVVEGDVDVPLVDAGVRGAVDYQPDED